MPKLVDVVTSLQVINSECVVETRNEDDKSVIVIDKSVLGSQEQEAMMNLLNVVRGWHLDTRPRKDWTWKVRPN